MSANASAYKPVWDFSAASRQAVRNKTLRDALFRATGKFDDGRREIMATLPQSEQVREKARQIKDEVLANLDTYLAEFSERAEAAGAHVHWAANGEQANEIVVAIAREHGVRNIVKSKSMVSEETHLNDALGKAGLHVVESDLGEYILQVASDHPSHIVVPAVHRTKEEIADLFNNAFDADLPSEPTAITAFARKRLRDEFAGAEMGITGANFACADTGTIVQVTNEGNGRLSTTWPRVHVVFTGIEKLIPGLADLPVFLKLLARSATGQPLTIYTNLITGPRRTGEGDGAQELHIVLLDNGRTDVHGSGYHETLRCIRCGACLNTCPVYRAVGGHAYGGIYPGPIGSLLTPLYEGKRRFRHLPHASSLCGACYEACPVKINIPQMLIEMKADQAGEGMTPFFERMTFRVWSLAMRSKLFYRLGARFMRWGLLQFSRDGWASWLPGPFGGWTDHREFALPKDEPFHTQWKRLQEGEARAD